MCIMDEKTSPPRIGLIGSRSEQCQKGDSKTLAIAKSVPVTILRVDASQARINLFRSSSPVVPPRRTTWMYRHHTRHCVQPFEITMFYISGDGGSRGDLAPQRNIVTISTSSA